MKKILILLLALSTLNLISAEIINQKQHKDNSLILTKTKKDTGSIIYAIKKEYSKDKSKTLIKEAIYYLNEKGEDVVKIKNYDLLGFMTNISEFKNAKLHGKTKINFEESDKLKIIVEYKEGIRHGITEEFLLNGSLKSTSEYKNDLLHGRLIIFYKDTKQKDNEYFYENGKIVGFIKYREDGTIIKKKMK